MKSVSEEPIVLVTGSTGLIGRAFVRDLTRKRNVLGLDLKAPQDDFGLDHWIHCDLTDRNSVRKALSQVAQRSGRHIASVVHLAAYYDFSGRPSPLYEKLTVEGSQRLLEELQPFHVEQFVFSSSILVMKPLERADGTRLNENSPVLAEWAYPQSKLRAENVMHTLRGDIPLVIHRIAGVYDDFGHSIPISQQIWRILERKLESHLFPGDAQHGQPYIHLNDLSRLLVRTVEQRAELADEELFLVAEPGVMSHEELQDEIGRLIHGKEWSTFRVPELLAKFGAWAKAQLPGADPFIKPWMIDLADDHYPVDTSKAEQLLGWRAQHTLSETLPRIVKALCANPEDWYREHDLPDPENAERYVMPVSLYANTQHAESSDGELSA